MAFGTSLPAEGASSLHPDPKDVTVDGSLPANDIIVACLDTEFFLDPAGINSTTSAPCADQRSLLCSY